MPAWMEYVHQHDVMRFCQMATRVWGVEMNFEDPEETAMKGIRAFRAFLKSIGMPTTFAELGADPADIPVLVDKLGIGDSVRGGFMPLNAEDVANIYKIAARV